MPEEKLIQTFEQRFGTLLLEQMEMKLTGLSLDHGFEREERFDTDGRGKNRCGTNKTV